MLRTGHSGIIVGLTGQTGAGKSTVSGLLERRGYSVINADKSSREVTGKGKPCLDALAAAFGEEILNPDGTLNRVKLADIAFNDKAKREKLNKITHPYIIDAVFSQADELLKNGKPVVFIDAPTLFESGADALCDKVVSVIAPEDERLARIISRDGLSLAGALARMGAQNNDSFYTARSDYIIENRGANGLESLAEALENMLGALKIPPGNGVSDNGGI